MEGVLAATTALVPVLAQTDSVQTTCHACIVRLGLLFKSAVCANRHFVDYAVRGSHYCSSLVVSPRHAITMNDANTAVLYAHAMQANCKSGSTSQDPSLCEFNFTRVPNQPGLLLPSVDQASPAAARPYDPARARYGGRPPTLCAVLSHERSLTGPANAPTANAVAAGVTALPTEPFCGQQQSLNYTLSFDGIECGTDYNFTAQATATPVGQGTTPSSAQLAFNVSC